ncbi:hypothetical protein B0T22DRAFT_379539 [Podospora appendiculata]|uniref:C2H2-type domain-containing protein n=1 Tax=Podospora appendiculata TaxID=314037 RepID=A0AAE0XDD9_9PEZI|nr:hypothetical protein B0T22DRAFT_379539 [Podospora appendiculata]
MIARDPRASFASSANRDSMASSIFSTSHLQRISTISSAGTRFSMRQSSVDSDPMTSASPWTPERQKYNLDSSKRYCCTFCEASFELKNDWKMHELDYHDEKDKFVCSRCQAVFSQAPLLASHYQESHHLEQSAPLEDDNFGFSAPRSAWGCGFCAAPMQSRSEYLEHVGNHYEEGMMRHQWQHSLVIKGLLHQPELEAAWGRLVLTKEGVEEENLHFHWDPSRTGRSFASTNDTSPPRLQDRLEYLAFNLLDPMSVAMAAYELAEISKPPFRDREEKLQQSPIPRVTGHELRMRQETQWLAINTSASATFGSVSKSNAPLPPPAIAPSSTPLLSPPAFSSRMTGKPSLCGKTALNTVLASIKESKASSSALSSISSIHQPTTAMQDSKSRAPRPGELRRIDSERSLHTVKSDFDALRSSGSALRSFRETASRNPDLRDRLPLSEALLELAPETTQIRKGWLMVTEPKAPSSIRSSSNSSIVSTRTMDRSQGFDGSESDLESDGSFSEPDDSWLLLDDGRPMPANLKVWSKVRQSSTDELMERLWIRYNHDWDFLIRVAYGGDSKGNSPRGEPPNRVQKARSSSARGPLGGRSLRPNAGFPFEDDEDDDDDPERSRPPSAQSKRRSISPKRFACPFRKHDPRTYNLHDHEVCTVKNWPTIPRLKEHLYRRHYRIHCQRCKETFRDTKDLASHEMMPEGCLVSNIPPPGDITTYQEKQLKSRKHTARHQSDEEKWTEIYKLLFPDDDIVPSPYPEYTDDLGHLSPEAHNKLDFQHYLLTSLPRLFHQTAEEHAGRHMQALDVLPMESIPKIIDDSLHRAFRAWESQGRNVPAYFSPTFSVSENGSGAPPSPWGQPEPSQNSNKTYAPTPSAYGNLQAPPPPPPTGYEWGHYTQNQHPLFSVDPPPSESFVNDSMFVGGGPVTQAPTSHYPGFGNSNGMGGMFDNSEDSVVFEQSFFG